MAATDLERLVVSLDADIRKFEKELKRANNVADGQFRQIERRGNQASKNLSNVFGKLSLGSIGKNAFIGFAAGATAALAPVALLTAAIQGTRNALAEFGKLADEIKPTGLNPEIYQALSLAALEAGSSQEELNAALLIFAKNVGLAQSGTGPLVAGLQKLNPELLKAILSAKDQDERLRLVADAMKKAGDSTRQAALASVAFGRGGVKIVEALKGGSAAIDEFIRKGKEMGVLLTQSDLDQADELADKMDVLAFAINTNLNRALVKMAPLLVAGAQGMAKFAKAVADLSNSEIDFEGITTLLGPQLRLLDPSGNLGAFLGKGAGEADALIDKMSSKGSAAVQALAADIKQALAEIPSGLITPEQIASLDALIAKLGENGEGVEDVKRKLQELAKSNPEFQGLADKFNPLLDKLAEVSNATDVKNVTAQISALFNEYRKGLSVLSPESLKPFDDLKKKIEAGTISAEDAKKAIAAIADNDPRLANLIAAFNPLLDKLDEVIAKAGKAGAALATLGDERGLVDRSGGEVADFFERGRSDAGRSSQQRELDAKSEEVLNRAKAEGIELTETVARAEAERELALEDAQKEREKSDKDSDKSGDKAIKDANKERERQDELIRDTIASIKEENASIGFETEHINDSNSAREQARVVFEAVNRLTAEGIVVTDDLRASIEREAAARGQQVAAYDAAADAADKLAQAQEDLAAQQAEVNDAFRDSMHGFISDLAHGKSLTDSLTSALGKLGDKLLDMALDNLFGKSGDSGFGLIGELFGGASGKGGSSATPFKANTTFTDYLASAGSGVTGGGAGTLVGGSGSSNTLLGGNSTINGTTRMGAELATIRTATGLTAQVNAQYSQQFQGLVNDLEKTGYKIKSIGGYNFRNIAGTNKLSNHAYGDAIDINPMTNPDTGRGGPLITDLPSGVGDMANRRGFNWGGDWRSKKDAMHFEVANPEKASAALDKLGTSATMTSESVTNLGQGSASALNSFGQATVDATKGLGQFGSSLSSFLSSSMGGGSNWFQGLSGMFGGSGGAFNFMNSISPGATTSIINAGGGFTGLYADGGYTGAGGKDEPAGVVHKGEFVFSKAATTKIGASHLDAMHKAASKGGYASGGLVGYAAGGIVRNDPSSGQYDGQTDHLWDLNASADRAAASLNKVGSSGDNASSGLSGILSSIPSLIGGLFSGGSSSGGGGLLSGIGSVFSGLFGGGGAASSAGLGVGLFDSGGYTGDMGTATPAGVVHGKEFVINAVATARNRPLLEAINDGMLGYAAGGFVPPRGMSASPDIEIPGYADGGFVLPLESMPGYSEGGFVTPHGMPSIDFDMPGYAKGGFVLPRLRKLTGAAAANSKGSQTVNITVNTPDAASFMRSQNQIAAKTAASVDRFSRTQ